MPSVATPTFGRPPMTPSTPASSNQLAGRCYCGAVQYVVDDSFEYALNCHCSNCRRTTGSAFKPFAGISIERLRITQGDGSLLRHGGADAADAADLHCARCGSLLYS